MQQILLVFLGGFLTLAGSIATQWYVLGKSRKRRMEEIIAEKKVTANGEAYSRMKAIQSTLSYGQLEKTYRFLSDNEEWFFNTRLFLPYNYPSKWLSIRNEVSRALQLESQSEENVELGELKQSLIKLASEGINEIYKEMGLGEITIDPLPR